MNPRRWCELGSKSFRKLDLPNWDSANNFLCEGYWLELDLFNFWDPVTDDWLVGLGKEPPSAVFGKDKLNWTADFLSFCRKTNKSVDHNTCVSLKSQLKDHRVTNYHRIWISEIIQKISIKTYLTINVARNFYYRIFRPSITAFYMKNKQPMMTASWP